jgi:predicted phage terminase large subunit-like protein
LSEQDDTFKSWHFTSYDNPLIDPNEIETAKKSMSSFAFRQEFMASFEAQGGELFKEEWIVFDEEEPDGDYFIAIDLAGFADESKGSKSKKLDESAIAVVKTNADGWWVKEIIHGRWTVEDTAKKIFNAVKKYEPMAVGIERGIAKQAVMLPLGDMMRRTGTFFRIEELTHGNKKKTDRIVWSLQGRFEHGQIKLNKGEWNTQFLDQLFQFPNHLVHDDLIDALSYIDQLSKQSYVAEFEEDNWEPMDSLVGY